MVIMIIYRKKERKKDKERERERERERCTYACRLKELIRMWLYAVIYALSSDCTPKTHTYPHIRTYTHT